MIKAPLPSTIELGSFQISLYGLLIGIGAVIILETLGKKFKQIKTIDYILLGIFALIGGKLLYMLTHIGGLTLATLFSGGFRIYGVIIGLILGVLVIAKYRSVSRFKIYDTLFLVFPIAQSFGRIGNFLNNELYGKPTDWAIGLSIPIKNRLAGYEGYASFHPLFMYEIILKLISFGILLYVSKMKKLKTGTVSSLFLINYGIIRLLLNTIRLDLDYIGGVEVSSFLSVSLILIGLIVLFAKYSKKKLRTTVAKVFSIILGPMIALPLPLLLTTFAIGTTNWKEILVMSIAILGPIPLYFILKARGKVSNIDITDRAQRPLFMSFLILIFWIAYHLSVGWGLVLMSEVLLVLVFLMLFFLIVTTFWKISGHMTMLIYFIASLYVLFGYPWMIYLFALVPVLAWSRVELKRHSIAQVVMGTITAFIITVGLYWLI